MAVLDNMEGDDSAEKHWLVQMRYLIQSAIYNISYMRCLFSEEYFRDASVLESGVIVKRLIPKDVESRRLIDWIEQGVDDALKKRYLETILFCISEKNEGATVDEYSFKFRYPSQDEAVMEFSLAGSNINGGTFKSSSAESTDIQIRTLIRLCATITNTMDPIPEERTILMKLMYNDDMTPEDYEPPLFECCLGDEDEKDLVQLFGRLCCITEKAPTILLDSGSTHHICCERSYMTEMKKISKRKRIIVFTADGDQFMATESGSIEFRNIHLNQMRYIPTLQFNFVSIGYLDKQGLLITINNSAIYVIDVNNSVHVGEGYRHSKNNDYVLKAMNWVVSTEVEIQQREELVEEEEENASESWVVDTCCATHMAGRLAMLDNPKRDDKEYHTPRGTMKASYVGSVSKGNVKLSDVRYCSKNADNLISAGVLDSQGHMFTFYKGVCTIVCKEAYTEVARAELDNSNLLYYVKEIEITKASSKRKKRKFSKKNRV